jgi:chloramphenicol 3-O-phosphotransferase
VRSSLLLLVGAPGAGKTTLLEALSTLLERERVGHGAIESEQLSLGWPQLGSRSWVEQLAAVLAMQRDAGRDTFLVTATVEDEDELRSVLRAAGAQDTLVVCLRVSAQTAAERVARREPEHWPGRQRLIEHARELAPRIPGLRGVEIVLDSEQLAPEELAALVFEAMREHRLLSVRRPA